MESGTRNVSNSNATDPRASAVDPVVAIDPISVEAAAMDHAVIIVDEGQTSWYMLPKSELQQELLI
uniref:Uncharacterized protein n=1 Tax=Oryza meridionalis TaxID=40149 RepID=A0A0E0EJ07_9ORYZ